VIDTDGRQVVVWCPATGRRDVLQTGEIATRPGGGTKLAKTTTVTKNK
jgi:hypothetical protein